MSDIPPPPGAVPPPPPPPPPGDLVPPPGYAAYTPSPMSSVRLQRVGGLATTITILTAAVAALTLLSTLVSGGIRDDARRFLADEITEDDFIEAYAPAALLGVAQSAALLALAVLTIVWMYRVAANHKTLGRVGTWGPGWAIGGWFLPPLVLYVIPFLMFRELWKASDPDVPVGDDRWKQSSVSPVVPAWWLLYGVAPLVVAIWQGIDSFSRGFATGDVETLAELIDDQYTLTVISALLLAAAAVAYVILVRGLTDRHRRLTGEATTPR